MIQNILHLEQMYLKNRPMKKLSFSCLFIAFCFLTTGLSAQEECGQNQYLIEIEKKHPHLLNKKDKIEEGVLSFRNQDKDRLQNEYKVSLVFHIIQEDNQIRVTDDEVYQAIKLLNDAYSNSGIYKRVDGTSSMINFCLAVRDESNQSSSGINRVVSPLNNLEIEDDHTLKSLINWDPSHIINVYVVNSINGGGVAGYAYLPYNHGSIDDGVVVLSSVIKDQGGSLHSTFVHEMGHYLGLYHTFEGACENNNCSVDGDRVCDTPPDGSTSSPGFCEAYINSCFTDAQSGFTQDTQDLNWNYLDYGNRNCRKGFTKGQIARMQYFLEKVRYPLLSSVFCESPCQTNVTSFFIPDATTIEVGKELGFTNQSTNAGAYYWLINGQEFSTSLNGKYTFSSPGSYEVTLVALGFGSGCKNSYSITIQVVCSVKAQILNPTLECKTGETLNFNHFYSSGVNQIWKLNAVVASTSSTYTHTFTQTGTQILELQVWDPAYPSCISYDTIYIQVNCDAAADFLASTNFPAMGSSVNFNLISSPKQKTAWYLDNALISTQANTGQAFSAAGSYQICMIHESTYCADTSCQIIFCIDTIQNTCTKEALAVLGTPGEDEAYDIIQHNGKFILAGEEDNISSLIFCDNFGNIEWKVKLDVFQGRTSRIKSIIKDGNDLVMCGYTWPYEDNFVIRFSLTNFSVVWCRYWETTAPDDDILVQILKDENFYYVLGQSYNNNSGLGCDALFLKLQKSDGGVVSQKNFDLGSCETFIRSYIEGNAIYCVGRFNKLGGGTSGFRGSLTKLDLDGNYEWCRLYVKEPAISIARLYSNDLEFVNNNIFVAGYGNFTGTTLTNVLLYLIKTDLTGKSVWQKQYEIQGITDEGLYSIEKTNDGIYFMMIANRAGNQDIVVMKTDFNGDAIWAKAIDGGAIDLGYQMLAVEDVIYIVGKTTSKGFGKSDVLFFSMDKNGVILENACFSTIDLAVQTRVINNGYDGLETLKPFEISLPISGKNTQPSASSIMKSNNCSIVCKDTCQNGLPFHSSPDVLIRDGLVYCDGQSAKIRLTLCNLDSVALPAGNPITFYNKNPFEEWGSVVYQLITEKELLPFSCLDIEIQSNFLWGESLYVLANNGGINNLPIDIQTYIPDTGVKECDYTNNIFELKLMPYESPVLELGPDKEVCANTVIELSANAQFASYVWSDGSRERVTYVGDPGIYSVTVVDECGFSQTDSIEIKTLPNSVINLSDTLHVCENDKSIAISGNYNSIKWYPPNAISCDTCSETLFLGNQNQTLYAVAVGTGNCISTDSVFVNILRTSEASINKELCERDTLYFLDKKITLPGEYQFKLLNREGCDSTIHLKVFIEPAPTAEFETTNSCPNQETGAIQWETSLNNQVWLNGQIQNVSEKTNLPSGIYNFRVLNALGCVHDTQLVIADYILAPLEFQIETPDCDDEKSGAVIFQDEVEIYDENLNYLGKQALYDLSTGEYVLHIRDNQFLCFIDTTVVVPPAGDTLNIIYPDTVYVQKNIPFLIEPGYNAKNVIYEWLPDEGLDCTDCAFPTLIIANNAAYTVEVTDEAGCSAIKRIVFVVALDVESSNIILLNSESNSKWTIHNLAGKQKISIDIFDRWGSLIYHFLGSPNTDGTFSWDGTLNGKKVEQGVYVAVLKYIDEEGVPRIKFFDLTIVSQ